MVTKQIKRYQDNYKGQQTIRRLARFDIRYRQQRLPAVAEQLGIDLHNQRVMDVGFGGGHLLATFPSDCQITGAEISRSAVERARTDPRYERFEKAEFQQVREGIVDELPEGPFDKILSSHMLEHVPDDRALLKAIYSRLAPGGHFFLFVPIEPEDYNPIHVRHYCTACVTERVSEAGLEVLFSEGSMYYHSLWAVATIPCRREWPVLGPLAHYARLWTHAFLPHEALRTIDGALKWSGFPPRQALVIARKPS